MGHEAALALCARLVESLRAREHRRYDAALASVDALADPVPTTTTRVTLPEFDGVVTTLPQLARLARLIAARSSQRAS